MPQAEEINFKGERYYARELTAREIDTILSGPAAPPPGESGEDAESDGPPDRLSIFDLIFGDEPINSHAVNLSTQISYEDLNGDVCPTELSEVLEAVKKANPFLVKAVENGVRVAGAAKDLKAMLKQLSDKQSAG